MSSHAKYLQYRERDPEQETKADRQFFNEESDAVDRRWVVKTTPYYRDRSVAHLANLPYPVTPMHQGPLAPTSGIPPQTPPPAASVIDADQDDPPTQAKQTPAPDIQQHFLDEE